MLDCCQKRAEESGSAWIAGPWEPRKQPEETPVFLSQGLALERKNMRLQ
jgi:hypothetical protein